MSEKVLRNSPEILGYKCEFKRVYVPPAHGRCRGVPIDVVYLNDIFVGTIMLFSSRGFVFVTSSLDSKPLLFRGISRVKAIEQYILSELFRSTEVK